MFELPALKYTYNELEPHIDAKTMEIHHTKHHQAYIDKLNQALSNYPDLQNKTLEELLQNLKDLPEDIQTAVRNHGGGHFNHSLFWRVMSPNPSKPSAELIQKIQTDLDGIEKFIADFEALALNRFGSGWAWLSVSDGKLVLSSTPNQDNPLMDGNKPILGIDVWEHAYYLNYQNRRADYIKSWWNVVDWQTVEQNLNS